MYLRNVILAAIFTSVAAFSQTADAPFQVRYAANLNAGESYIDIVNTGANGAALLGPGFGTQTGNICVNVYAFDPQEELISCCSCYVTPDQVVNLGVVRDLTSNIIGKAGVPPPTSVTVKLLATLDGTNGTGNASGCINSAANVVAATTGVSGMAAWGTTLHATPAGSASPFATTETPFTPATLSPQEAASIGGRCAAILGNLSGAGVCNSCQLGALGSQKIAH
jgi:hypothetical protein